MAQRFLKCRIATVDLEGNTVEFEELPSDITEQFLGARGINGYLLFSRFPFLRDPLSPQSPLILGAGLLTGLPCPAATRMNFTAKSPETGYLGDSNMGGSFGTWLRRAGFEHLVVTGRASEPVYIHIRNRRCELLDARQIWGKDTQETQRRLRKRHGKTCQAIVIGPAGERQVRFAAVMHNQRSAAARCGIGCLMGSKNLKAIVVSPGEAIPIADPEQLTTYTRELWKRLDGSPTIRALREYGTPYLFALHNRQGIVRTRGTSDNQFRNASRLSSRRWRREYFSQSVGCYGCRIRCHHIARVTVGPREGLAGEGPEYGTLAAFGPICGINEPEAILALNNLVNRYGLDSVTTGNLIAWAVECFTEGLLSPADTGGQVLSWGDPKTIIQLVHDIAHRRGFGDVLARGTRFLAEAFPEAARERLVQIKGLIQSDGVDVRSLKGFALGIATASRGADHLRNRPTMEILGLTRDELRRIYGEPVSPDPGSYQGKARMVFRDELDYAVGDALGVCRFIQRFNSPDHLGLEEFRKLILFATGLELSIDALRYVGERITTLERLYLAELGLGRRDDQLPPVYFKPRNSGSHAGESIDRDEFDRMLSAYYAYHGWDERSGEPTPETLRRLNLSALHDSARERR